LEGAGLGFVVFFGSPTTETAPFVRGTSSFVQTFLGFFVSAGGAEFCGWLCSAGALLS